MAFIKKSYKKQLIIFGTIAIVINLLIIIESCLPGPISEGQSSWAADVISKLIHIPTSDEFRSNIRKIVGHIGLFMIDGLFTSIFFHYLYLYEEDTSLKYFSIFSIFTGVGVALLSELIQLIVPGRYFTLLDIGIDIGGYLLGFVIILIIKLIKNHKKQNI